MTSDRRSLNTSVNKDWNHHPELPIATNPIFEWPPRPIAAFRWIARRWLAISMQIIEISLAFLVFYLFYPALEDMISLHVSWILRLWLCNLSLVIIIAGGLHLYLYSFNRQEKQLKYDARVLSRNNGTFSFSNQVFDNMFWTLASGVSIWTLYQIAYFWAAANGLVPVFYFADNPVFFALMFIVIPLWSSLHFYWIHRLLHWPPLYRIAHALHHRNINIGPWSGISMHPVEHVIYFSSFLIHFIVPSHPLHFIFHTYFVALGPIASHSGFEGIVIKDRKQMHLGEFFHQLHHRYFECNYGTVEMPWDRWFGSYHDGSENSTQRTRSRRKAMYAGYRKPAKDKSNLAKDT